jgi:hypothetical protein
MSDAPDHRVDDPQAAMDKMRAAMGQILNVSKKEILKREANVKEARKRDKKKAA